MKRIQVVVCAVVLAVSTVRISGAGSEVADAVMNGDGAAVRKLIAAKADVNAPQVDGATALHWAVYRDDVETANALIAAGAKVEAANREGTTPLAAEDVADAIAYVVTRPPHVDIDYLSIMPRDQATARDVHRR